MRLAVGTLREAKLEAVRRALSRLATIPWPPGPPAEIVPVSVPSGVPEMPLSEAKEGKYIVLIAPTSIKDIIKVGDEIKVLENEDVLKVKVGDETFELSKDFGKKIIITQNHQ